MQTNLTGSNLSVEGEAVKSDPDEITYVLVGHEEGPRKGNAKVSIQALVPQSVCRLRLGFSFNHCFKQTE